MKDKDINSEIEIEVVYTQPPLFFKNFLDESPPPPPPLSKMMLLACYVMPIVR